MFRSFYIYFCFLAFFGCAGRQIEPTDILFEANAFQKADLNSGDWKAGDLACFKDSAFIYVETLAICNCLVRNKENDWVCQGSLEPNCRLASTDCFCGLFSKPKLGIDNSTLLRKLLLKNLACNPDEDITQWRLEIMECRRQEIFHFWLRQPESDGQCQKERKEEKK